MRFILLAFDKIQKTPRAEEVVNTRMPRRFEKIKLVKIKIDRIIIERYL